MPTAESEQASPLRINREGGNRVKRRQFLRWGLSLAGCFSRLRALDRIAGAPAEIAHPNVVRLTDSLDAGLESRVGRLLARMSIQEKVRQLCSLKLGKRRNQFTQIGEYTPATLRSYLGSEGVGCVSLPIAGLGPREGAEVINLIQQISAEETRLGIPPIVDGEGVHGLRANGSCVFPVPIAMGATWNPELVEQIAVVVGRDARSRGIRRVFAPVLNLAHDPRHGRTEETYGEDPYLAARLGVAFVRGMQSMNVIAAPKHFIANFEGAGGRDSEDVELSERILREEYFVPFKAAVVEGGALGLMCAYNSINALPCVFNRWLLTDVLRGEWEFQGVVVSDWGAIRNSIDDLHSASSQGEAARRALHAGTDMETPRFDIYENSLAGEVAAGRCSVAELDEAVRRVLRLKVRLGLFDHRYNNSAAASQGANTGSDRNLALHAARESIVLLRNNRAVLPLAEGLKRIAVIGPNADQVRMGGYSPEVVDSITPLEVIKRSWSEKATITFAKGCELLGEDESQISEAVAAVSGAEVCIAFVGGSRETAAEELDRADLALTGKQESLILAAAATGRPVVVVLIAGGPVIMTRWIDKVDAVLAAWYSGEEGANAIADILNGKCNPSGHLPVTFPQFTGQLPMPYNQRPYGRPGTSLEENSPLDDIRYRPLFPFGFGLSYTSFSYSGESVMPAQVSRDGTVEIAVTVTNTGKRAGDDVVQLYLTSVPSPVVQPSVRLCDFKRIALNAGESKSASFILGRDDLAILNEELKPEVMLGRYTAFIGQDCQHGIKVGFEIVESGYGDPFS
jgi:beta-glucosidase